MGKNVVIIGAGIVGLATAYYCRRHGHQVEVLERDPAQRDGCSFGNAGLVVPSHFIPLAAPGMVALGLKCLLDPESPFYIKLTLDPGLFSWAFKFWQAANARHVQRAAPLLRDLNLASRQCFEELAQLPDTDFGFTTKGLLLLCKTERTWEEEARVADQAHALGLAAEVLDARQVRARQPQLHLNVAGGVFFPQDCHLSPARLMAALQQHLERDGVRFHWQSEVTGWTTTGAQVQSVQTTRGDFCADSFVLCGGAWSPRLVRTLGLRLPLQAGKGYSLTLPHPPELPDIPAILTEARLAVTPMGQSLRFGGTMEIAGLTTTINPARIRGIIKSVPKYLPAFGPADFADIQPWCGLRPCSPDGLPYVGRTRRYSNLLLATGHAMMGVSLAPITGKLIAELVSGESPCIDIRLLDPERYT